MDRVTETSRSRDCRSPSHIPGIVVATPKAMSKDTPEVHQVKENETRHKELLEFPIADSVLVPMCITFPIQHH